MWRIYASEHYAMTGSDTGSVPSYYPNQYRLIVDRTLKNQFYWDFNQHAHIFIHGNGFDKVLCNIMAIMSRGHRWVWTHRCTGVVPLTRRHLHVITLHMVNEYCHKQPSYSSINIQRNNALVQCSVNSFLTLWSFDAIWRHGIRSTVVQIMACCLTVPCHYQNQRIAMLIENIFVKSVSNFKYVVQEKCFLTEIYQDSTYRATTDFLRFHALLCISLAYPHCGLVTSNVII